MALLTRTEFNVDASPIKNGNSVKNNEEVIQVMWDHARANFKTDMKALQFSSLERQQKYSWAVALKRFIDQNDDIKIVPDDELKTPDGRNIQICRTVTIKANETNALNFGPAVMLASRQQHKTLLLFSLQSYNILKSYIQDLQPSAHTARALGNAFALAALMNALSNLDDDD